MEEKTLPSGARLRVALGSFGESKALYQAVARELTSFGISGDTELEEILGHVLASTAVEAALLPCLKRCLYNDARITDLERVFQSAEARADYLHVCWEVAHANLLPFMRNLPSLLAAVLETLAQGSKAASQKEPSLG